MQAVLDGRRIALLERFTVDGWVDAVREHRPKTVSLVPTALRMVLDADVAPDVFASIRSVVSGTAPLDPDLADAFTERYGVPVLTSYGATEFGGGVAGWNFADHQEFGAAKRGSVGRAHAGCDLRIVDPEAGTDLGADAVGLLEVRAAQLGTDDWVRTTDLARLDADGFLWIVGRADQTILRGGYKVQPEVVRAALERDPGVVEAAVVGVPDPRLGAVPVAAIERRPGHELDEASLLAGASAHLARLRGAGRDLGGRRAAAHRVGQGRPGGGPGDVRPHLRGDRGMTVEKWYFGEDPLPDVEAFADAVRELASTVQGLEHSNDELRRITADVRAAQARLAAHSPGDLAPRVGADDAPGATRRTSTTHATSAASTRRSRCTSSRARTIGPRARSSSPCSTRGRPGSCTAGSSRCSSTACCSSSTATSASRARPPRSR